MPCAVHFQAEHHVLLDRQPGKQRIALKDHAAVAPGSVDRLALQQYLAAGVFFQSGEDADERGLAAAGRPDDAQEFAPMGREIDVVERRTLFVRRHRTSCPDAHVQNDVARLHPVKRARTSSALLQIGRQDRCRRRTDSSAAAVQWRPWQASGPRETNGGRASASTMSVPEPDDADHDDRRIDIGEMLVARLLGDEPGNARRRADQFGDDQIGPGPAEQNALIAIEIGQYSRDDDSGEQLGDSWCPA